MDDKIKSGLVPEGTYVTIQSWMVNDLGLSGVDLICYAIINGFSQDGESCFKGNRKYLAGWIGCSIKSIDRILVRLTQNGCVEKISEKVNGVVFNSYKAVRPNIANGYKITFQDEDDERKKESAESLRNYDELYKEFEDFVKLYKKLTKKATRSVKTEFEDFKTRHKDWAEVIPYLAVAITRETKERQNAESNNKFFPCPKMLQTYLGKQRAWELYVTVGEDVNKAKDDYLPIESPMLAWNDYYNCYLYIGGFYDGKIYDGYNDEDRPDGATVMLNNARGTLRWNSQTKTWDKI